MLILLAMTLKRFLIRASYLVAVRLSSKAEPEHWPGTGQIRVHPNRTQATLFVTRKSRSFQASFFTVTDFYGSAHPDWSISSTEQTTSFAARRPVVPIFI